MGPPREQSSPLAAGEAAARKDLELTGFFQNCFQTTPWGGMQQRWLGAASGEGRCWGLPAAHPTGRADTRVL